MTNTNNIELLRRMSAERNKLESSIKGVNQKIYDLQNKIKTLASKIEQEILYSNKEIVQKFEEAGAVDVSADLDNNDSDRNMNEDDGTLHITIGKIHGCFISDQDLSKSEWNKLARPIVKLFGFSWSDLNR